VHKVCYNPTGAFYAIKKMSVLGDEEQKEGFENENSILDHINQNRPHDLESVIQKICAFTDEQNRLCLVLELCDMNLHQKVFQKPLLPSTSSFIRQLVLQLLQAFSFLESQKIVHSDVKPTNILCKGTGQFVLADFGSAFIEPFCAKKDAWGNDRLLYRQTSWYRSPECTIFTQGYTTKIDLWSLGCICVELFFKKALFPNSSHLELYRSHREKIGEYPESLLKRGYNITALRKEVRPLYDSIFTSMENHSTDMAEAERSLFVDFVQGLLVIDPSKRTSASEASEHAFIRYCI
jgi:dual specificity protein kinase YAK1